MSEERKQYDTWVNGYTSPEGRIIVEDSVEGKYGSVWVYVVDTGKGYCVVCQYDEIYQPPLGDEYYYTKDLGRALAEYEAALENVRDGVQERDEYEDWLMERE